MLFRAYYATVYGRMMRTANGIPTNAVFGFVTMFQKALEQIEPDGVLVAWDAGKPTFRHEAYQEYKGTRLGSSLSLRGGLGALRRACQADPRESLAERRRADSVPCTHSAMPIRIMAAATILVPV